MRLYKRDGWFHLDAAIDGRRVRQSLKTNKYREAQERAAKLITDIKEGKARRTSAAKSVNKAIDFYLQERELHAAPKTVRTDRERSVAIRRFFGDSQLSRISVEDVVSYQRARLASGIKARTVNMEIGLLRRILKRQKQWARLADDVRNLPERRTAIRILTADEKRKLFILAGSKAAWSRVALAATIAASTTMRGCEIKGLQWKNVELDKDVPVFRVQRATTKTDAGERVIPIHPSLLILLQRTHETARSLGAADPSNFVFPACESGRFDPTEPINTLRTAWRSLTKAAGLKGLRFHDLRHLAVTELAERGTGEQTIMSISGHVNRKMVEHYSHPRLEAKRPGA